MADKWIRYLYGYVTIAVRGENAERFLNLCTYHGITLWDIRYFDQKYVMDVSLSSFWKLKPMIRKTKINVRVIQRHGIPFPLYRMRKRFFFWSGLLIGMFLCMYCSTRIWKIEIAGNQVYTDSNILRSLKEQTIVPGIKKQTVDCETIEFFLRESLKQTSWVSVSILGSVLRIHIKEKESTVFLDPKEEVPMDLVAEGDGKILYMITRSGLPCVKMDEEVKKGDVLISGTIPIYDDTGAVIDHQYCKADGEILLKTRIPYQDELSMTKKQKEIGTEKIVGIEFENRRKTVRIGQFDSEPHCLLIGHSIFLFSDLKIRIYKELRYKEHTIPLKEKEVKGLLNQQFTEYKLKLQKKGVQILKNNVKIYIMGKKAYAKGYLELAEPKVSLIPGNRTPLPQKDLEEEE